MVDNLSALDKLIPVIDIVNLDIKIGGKLMQENTDHVIIWFLFKL